MKIEISQMVVLSDAVMKWGEESQVGMAIEECAEFIVAARKTSRVGGRELSTDADDRVIDEISDVIVMMEQMALIYGHEAVRQRVNFKIDRLKKRLSDIP